ncbi:MAG: DUF4129 domain-containing protein [Firmicutes bacterium]|nr:DUF4129 domain-containing protein [Bacillota bacterium]
MKRPNLISVSAAGVLRLAGFSLMFALLLAPWFQGLLFELAGGAFLLLSVTAARQPVLAVITGIACLFFVVIRGLSIYWAISVVLLLLWLGDRYPRYRTTVQFTTDFALGIIVMTILAFFCRVTVGQGILFFVVGVLLTASFAAEKLEAQGEKIDRRALTQMLPAFLAAVAVLASLAGAVFSPEIIRLSAAGLRYLYGVFVDAFIALIVRPLAWILQPLFNWLEGREGTFEWELPEFLEEAPLDEVPHIREFVQLNLNSPILWVAAAGLAVLVGALLLRRIMAREDSSDTVTLEDERESVFSPEEVFKSLQSVLESVLRPAGRIRRILKIGSSDPVEQVRAVYIRFAQRFSRQFRYEKDTTPREYKSLVADHVQSLRPVQEITALYEQARYGLTAREEDVRSAQQALKEVQPKKGQRS